jgi:hypothetical protein
MERIWQQDTAVSQPPLTHGTMKSTSTTTTVVDFHLLPDMPLKSFGRDLQNWDVHGFHVTLHPHRVITSCANTPLPETSLVLLLPVDSDSL